MSRATRFAANAGILAAIYLLLLLGVIPTPLVGDEQKSQVLTVFPWWALVSFGSYLLWNLGWGIFTFRDCPEAYEELLHDINTAKNTLRDQGVSVD